MVHFGRPSSHHWLLHPATVPVVHNNQHFDKHNKDNGTIPETSASVMNSIKCSKGSASLCNSRNSWPLERAVPPSVRENLPWPATPLLTALWNATAVSLHIS